MIFLMIRMKQNSKYKNQNSKKNLNNPIDRREFAKWLNELIS